MHSLDHDSVLLEAIPSPLPVWQTFQCTCWVLTHKTQPTKQKGKKPFYLEKTLGNNDIFELVFEMAPQVCDLVVKFTKAMTYMHIKLVIYKTSLRKQWKSCAVQVCNLQVKFIKAMKYHILYLLDQQLFCLVKLRLHAHNELIFCRLCNFCSNLSIIIKLISD